MSLFIANKSERAKLIKIVIPSPLTIKFDQFVMMILMER
jgi:hypothetical protein